MISNISDKLRRVFLCRDDVIAQLCHARALAKKLYPFARMVELHGGHLVSHERTEEVNFFPSVSTCSNYYAAQVVKKCNTTVLT